MTLLLHAQRFALAVLLCLASIDWLALAFHAGGQPFPLSLLQVASGLACTASFYLSLPVYLRATERSLEGVQPLLPGIPAPVSVSLADGSSGIVLWPSP